MTPAPASVWALTICRPRSRRLARHRVCAAEEDDDAGQRRRPPAPTDSTDDARPVDPCAVESLNLQTPGSLTIGTDSPAFPPWFEDDDPTNGKGFESAVAYAVAEQMGFTEDQVQWVQVPFNKSYAPGPKDFDFDINQISITPKRAEAVDFSEGYYDVAQAVVALEGLRPRRHARWPTSRTPSSARRSAPPR